MCPLLTARVRCVLHEVLDAVTVDDEALHGAVQADAHAGRPAHGVWEPEGEGHKSGTLHLNLANVNSNYTLDQSLAHYVL